MRIFRSALLTGAALMAGTVMAPAVLAQDGASDYSGLEDIIVTAQRRAESLQDVPISITAVSADQMAEARVENLLNVSAISPSVTFNSSHISSSTANVIIRGLGTTGVSRSFEGSVGIFIDGVYRTRAAAAVQNFLDLGNLQVLRGPQGTLFGKNTTAGAILISSNAPSLYEPSGTVDLGYGNYNSVLTRAAANVPLGDQIAIRVAGMAASTKGFFVNPSTGDRINDDSTRAIKGQILWEPSDGVSIRLIGDYLESSGNCCYGTSDFTEGPLQPLVDALTVGNGGVVPPRGQLSFQRPQNGNGHQVVKDYGGTLLIDADIGPGTLKSVTALRYFRQNQVDMDGDFSGADIFRYTEGFRSRFLSQELTYNTEIESLNADLVLGVFLSDEKLNMPRVVDWGHDAQAFWDVVLNAGYGMPPGTTYAPAGLWYHEYMKGTAKSYAGFAHFDMKVSEQFSLILGARYSIEKKGGAFGYHYYLPAPNDVLRVLGLRPGPAYDEKSTDKALSGTVGVQFRPVDDVMLYATYNRGFKAGGVNIDANAAGGRANNPDEFPGVSHLDPSYRPEKINAFEIGGKFEYLNRRARTNISFYYYDIKDLQIAQYVGQQFTVLNSSSAKDYGVEIDNLFQLTEGLTLGLDGVWIPHAKYDPDPLLDPVLADSRFRSTPKFQGNATLTMDQPVGDNLNITGRIQYQYRSSRLVSTASRAEVGSLSLLHANLGVHLPESGLRIEGWAQNLTNKTYATGVGNSPFQTGNETAFMGAPRTYGVRLRADF